jgi:tRNA(Leu) C34 or U34 (ribose-2'-O)-methylase TrmL
MRIHVISDLHGAVDHLREAGRGCDALLVLGDLINVLDYHSMDGILVEIFGKESVGLAPEVRERYRDRLVRIPIADPQVRSLNLSTAVALGVFEVLRQRRTMAASL